MKSIDRFWSKVDKNGPVPAHRPELGRCWLWIAGTTKGYGRFWLNGRPRGAHQVAWEMKHGPIPDGLEPDHLCRVRHCVNDAHLEPVTRAENTRRGGSGAVAAARQLAKTHCPQGHPYSGDNLYVTTSGYRKCRTCGRESLRCYKAKRRSDREEL